MLESGAVVPWVCKHSRMHQVCHTYKLSSCVCVCRCWHSRMFDYMGHSLLLCTIIALCLPMCCWAR